MEGKYVIIVKKMVIEVGEDVMFATEANNTDYMRCINCQDFKI